MTSFFILSVISYLFTISLAYFLIYSYFYKSSSSANNNQKIKKNTKLNSYYVGI